MWEGGKGAKGGKRMVSQKRFGDVGLSNAGWPHAK